MPNAWQWVSLGGQLHEKNVSPLLGCFMSSHSSDFDRCLSCPSLLFLCVRRIRVAEWQRRKSALGHEEQLLTREVCACLHIPTDACVWSQLSWQWDPKRASREEGPWHSATYCMEGQRQLHVNSCRVFPYWVPSPNWLFSFLELLTNNPSRLKGRLRWRTKSPSVHANLNSGFSVSIMWATNSTSFSLQLLKDRPVFLDCRIISCFVTLGILNFSDFVLKK